jgi:hypothetical protein
MHGAYCLPPRLNKAHGGTAALIYRHERFPYSPSQGKYLRRLGCPALEPHSLGHYLRIDPSI